MVLFPNCKINIGLYIINKRADGFHNLETFFYPIPLKDAVEIIPGNETSEVTFTTSGNQIDVKDNDNICIKAYQLIKTDYPQLPSIQMHLHKAIPTGAGLGGGSADATAVLQLLNNIFNLQISTNKLQEYALALGSDCPFFLVNTACFATGRGEVLTNVNINLSSYKILLVNPKIHINTKQAFTSLGADHFSTAGLLKQLIFQPIVTWKNNIKNDFEKPVFALHPQIEAIKNTLYHNGAIYSAMSGSGSTVYGIFEQDKIPNINFPSNYFCQLV